MNQVKQTLASLQPQLQQHMLFMSSVVENIDFQSLQRYIPVIDGLQEDGVNDQEEELDVHIAHPQYFNAATKLMVVVNIVDSDMRQADIDEETNDRWKKIIKPAIHLVINPFIGLVDE